MLVEMDADELPVTDTSILQYRIKNQRTIWGSGRFKYDSLALIFKYNAATDFFEPLGIRSAQNYSGPLQDTFLLSKLIENQGLTSNFLEGYFSKDESYFKDLVYEGGTKGLPASEKNIKLHLVIVADTMDIKLGKICLKDIKNVEETFDNLVKTLGIQKTVSKIMGQQFGVNGVKEAIKNIKLLSPNDIIVFYYTGHGFMSWKERTEKNHWPYLKLKSGDVKMQEAYDNTINIMEIFDSIKTKGARFNLVISDCCNDALLSSFSFGNRIGKVKSSNMDWSIDNCKNLFLKKASILATAADNGQKAAGNLMDGSYFTKFLSEALRNNLSRTTKSLKNWDNVMIDAKTVTTQFAKTADCPGGIKCSQDPYYIIR